MLKIKPPTKEIMVNILKSLYDGELKREEVVQWQEDLIRKFDYYGPGVLTVPLKVSDGYWEFVSLSALLKKSEIQNDPHEHFIRKEDLKEYVADLRQENLEKISGGFKFIRGHQIPKEERRAFPIVSMTDKNIFIRNQLRSVRGVMDNLGNLKEASLFIYDKSAYTVCIDHEHYPGFAMLMGNLDEEKDKIVRLLQKLNVAPQSIDWVSPELDSEKCKLVRLDDNANEFEMKTYDSYILAELTRIHFENKGHKQLYSLKKGL